MASSQYYDTHTSTKPEGLIKRSWHAVLSPFSSTALESLPDTSRRLRDRETRTDRIPEGEGGIVVRDYSAVGSGGVGQAEGNGVNVAEAGGASVNEEGTDVGGTASGLPISVRVPKKIATPIRVEGKVWFANERTWISYLNIGILLGTLALALFNASDDNIALEFAYVYAFISVCVLVYGWVVYQKRITMIRKRDPGHFDQIIGPVAISILLFCAVLANFILRVREIRRNNVPVPRD